MGTRKTNFRTYRFSNVCRDGAGLCEDFARYGPSSTGGRGHSGTTTAAHHFFRHVTRSSRRAFVRAVCSKRGRHTRVVNTTAFTWDFRYCRPPCFLRPTMPVPRCRFSLFRNTRPSIYHLIYTSLHAVTKRRRRLQARTVIKAVSVRGGVQGVQGVFSYNKLQLN